MSHFELPKRTRRDMPNVGIGMLLLVNFNRNNFRFRDILQTATNQIIAGRVILLSDYLGEVALVPL